MLGKYNMQKWKLSKQTTDVAEAAWHFLKLCVLSGEMLKM